MLVEDLKTYAEIRREVISTGYHGCEGLLCTVVKTSDFIDGPSGRIGAAYIRKGAK